jgi:hypothetical protein
MVASAAAGLLGTARLGRLGRLRVGAELRRSGEDFGGSPPTLAFTAVVCRAALGGGMGSGSTDLTGGKAMAEAGCSLLDGDTLLALDASRSAVAATGAGCTVASDAVVASWLGAVRNAITTRTPTRTPRATPARTGESQARAAVGSFAAHDH